VGAKSQSANGAEHFACMRVLMIRSFVWGASPDSNSVQFQLEYLEAGVSSRSIKPTG
jgi:hypothetical protein